MNKGLLTWPQGRGLTAALEGFPLGKPSRFVETSHSTEGDLTASTSPSVLTASGSTNTKGSYTEFVASAPFDADGFYIRFNSNSAVADYLADFAVGPSGSEVVIVPNLLVSGGSDTSAWGEVYVPLGVPAGERVAGRVQSSDASATVNCTIELVAGSFYAAQRMTQATNYGSDTSDSGGVQVDPGGSANTKGAWAVISSAIDRDIKYAIICVGSRNNGVYPAGGTNHLWDLGVGPSSSEVTLIDNQHVRASGNTDYLQPILSCRFLNVRAGERLIARAQSAITDATDRLFDVAIIGFD